MANDNDLTAARTAMAEFGGAVGTSDGLQRVCERIYAAAGIHRGEDLLAGHTENPYPGWRWLTEVAGEAARRQDVMLVARIFAFTTFWHTTVGPQLGPADWLDLMLPAPPKEALVAITAAGLPHLVRMPPDEVVTGNATEQMRAGLLADYAATQVCDSPELYSDAVVAVARKLLDPGAAVAPEPQQQDPHPLLAPAVAGLDRVKRALSEVGLQFVDLGAAHVGVGIGLTWGDTDWVVVSVAAGGLEDVVAVTAGVLKNVAQDRIRILEECNTRTRENTVYPVYLHDAQDGWDVLVQQRFHIEVLLGNAVFLRNTITNLPVYARMTREEFRRHGVRGEDHVWDAETAWRLLVRSML